MYRELDALFHGAVVALVAALPATLLFWRLTRGFHAGPRVARPLVVSWAAFGAIAALGALYALAFERVAFQDEAIAGALLMGGALQLLLVLVLLLIPRHRS
jgi:hypothetical protein